MLLKIKHYCFICLICDYAVVILAIANLRWFANLLKLISVLCAAQQNTGQQIILLKTLLFLSG